MHNSFIIKRIRTYNKAKKNSFPKKKMVLRVLDYCMPISLNKSQFSTRNKINLNGSKMHVRLNTINYINKSTGTILLEIDLGDVFSHLLERQFNSKIKRNKSNNTQIKFHQAKKLLHCEAIIKIKRQP